MNRRIPFPLPRDKQKQIAQQEAEQDEADARADSRDIISRDELKRNAWKVQKTKEREKAEVCVHYCLCVLQARAQARVLFRILFFSPSLFFLSQPHPVMICVHMIFLFVCIGVTTCANMRVFMHICQYPCVHNAPPSHTICVCPLTRQIGV